MRQGPIILFLGLPLLSGLLMWSAWPPFHTALPAFVGLIPLFLADDAITARYRRYTGFKVWLSVYTGLLIWNLLATWWVSRASLAGGAFAIIANAALMSVPYMLSRKVRGRFGDRTGYLAFIVFWMSFEYIHLQWEFTWPWLTIGNVFAAQYKWVQWYSVTGVFGGTLWVLLGNILGLRIIKVWSSTVSAMSVQAARRKMLPLLVLAIALIGIPIGISQYQYARYKDIGDPVKITVLQPNFDPYTEKFTIPYEVQMDKMLQLSMQKTDVNTDFLLWPETSIQDIIWLDRLSAQKPVRDLKKALDSLPNLTMIVGINGYERFQNDADKTATSRALITGKYANAIPDTMWYDVYNTALALNQKGPIGFYHKSKLVPGVERMPYPELLSKLNALTIELGGISGSLGIQKERTVFFNQDGIGIAPVICYESVFGEYVGNYVQQGAGIIGIITNDGWWGDSDGYKQHCMYASLRSIETRRCIARSANTGTSCFINQRGDISQATEWEEDAVISDYLPVNTRLTFYTRNGDYLARFAMWISAGILCIFAIYSIRAKWQSKK